MSEDIMFAIYVAIIVVVALMMALALWRGRHTASQNAKVVANQSVLIEQNKQAAELHLRQAKALERIADAGGTSGPIARPRLLTRLLTRRRSPLCRLRRFRSSGRSRVSASCQRRIKENTP